MATNKCPHCGEPVRVGQDKCYACGQNIRARGYRVKQRVNPLVLVLAGVIALVAVVAGIIALSSAGKKQAALNAQVEEQRVQDSVRKANRQMQTQVHEQNQDDATQAAIDELAGIEARYNEVKTKVVTDQASSAQQYIINQFTAELSSLKGLAGTIAATPPDKREAVRNEIRDGERKLRTYISDLPRALKK